MDEFDLEFIRERRKELAISSNAMAKELGFANASVYWKYETGHYRFKAKELPLLANALKCNLTDFYRLPNDLLGVKKRE